MKLYTWVAHDTRVKGADTTEPKLESVQMTWLVPPSKQAVWPAVSMNSTRVLWYRPLAPPQDTPVPVMVSWMLVVD